MTELLQSETRSRADLEGRMMDALRLAIPVSLGADSRDFTQRRQDLIDFVEG